MLDLRPVNVDTSRIGQTLSRSAGRQISDVEVAVRLRNSGFVPYGDGWIADDASIAQLQALLIDPDAAAAVTP